MEEFAPIPSSGWSRPSTGWTRKGSWADERTHRGGTPSNICCLLSCYQSSIQFARQSVGQTEYHKPFGTLPGSWRRLTCNPSRDGTDRVERGRYSRERFPEVQKRSMKGRNQSPALGTRYCDQPTRRTLGYSSQDHD